MSDQWPKAFLPITGYLDRPSARPGEALEIKVSAREEGSYHASMVRVLAGDPNPESPGIELAPVPGLDLGRHSARFQDIQPGSYALINGCPDLGGPILTLV